VVVALEVGDKLEEQARSIEVLGRTGVIEDVVRGDPSPRYRIRRDDGHQSEFTPAAGCLHKLPAGAHTEADGDARSARRV
jgi:hypothetical protein